MTTCGLRGIGLDLAPQPRDADVDAAIERLPVLVVGEIEQLIAREHPVGMLDERLQQVELHAGDRHLLAVGVVQPVRLEIEPAGADRHRRGGGRRIGGGLGRRCAQAPQHGPDAGQQLAQIDRLGDVVVGADLQPDHAIDHLARGGQHHDADLGVGAQEARQRQPVLARHVDVQQHQIGRLLGEDPAHRSTILGRAHAEAGMAQIVHQHASDLGLVVDDDDMALLDHDPRLPMSAQAHRAQRHEPQKRRDGKAGSGRSSDRRAAHRTAGADRAS